MKRIITTLLFMLGVVCLSYAQYVVTPAGLTKSEPDGNDYFVIEVPGASQSELYTRTLQYITETYNSPKDVISSQVENETIAVTGSHKIFFGFDVLYKIVYKFKDGKVRYDMPTIVSMTNFFDGKAYELTFVKTRTAAQNIYIFNKKGELRGLAIPNYKHDIEDMFNLLYQSYCGYMLNEPKNEAEEDW